MAIILPANSAADTGYTVANSCRFNDGDSAYMHKTPGSGSNEKTWTLSFWYKRGVLSGSNQVVFSFAESGGSNPRGHIEFDTDFKLKIGSNPAGSWTNLLTDMVFRDVTAWYHIVVATDTTQGTEANRIKVYVNGTQLSDFSGTYWGENVDTGFNTAFQHTIGREENSDNNYLDGYLAEVCWIDGSALSPTSFGEFDEDSPTIWKPIDVSGLTFGTNGFYLDFEDSANLGNDANGGTDLTEVNLAAVDQATDTPTNNFSVLNPNASLPNTSKSTFSEGNCIVVAGSDGSYVNGGSTIGVANGKWYAEHKLTNSTDSDARCIVGVTMDLSEISRINQDAGANNISYAYHYGRIDVAGSTSGFTSLATSDVNDIVGVALDMDNGKIYFHKNGTYINSGDPTSGSTGTGAAPVAASTTGLRFFFSGSDTNAGTMTSAWNFGGSPSFAISSGNADANGYGNFEYAVPSGYLALCTKNLGSDGG